MEHLLKEAIRLHQLGQLDDAELIYRQVLKQSSNDTDALHYLGVLLHQQGDSQAGLRLIRKAIKRNPNYADAHKNLGNVLKESGRLEKAEQCYRSALKLIPGDADAYNNLCVVLRLLKRPEEAIEAGVKSVNSNSENPVAWLNFGKALKAGGMVESAIAAFYRALNLDKEFVEAHNELCATLYRLERLSDIPEATVKQRTDAYEEWLRNEPDSPVANFMLAACRGDKTITRAPDEVVKILFDGFAVSFDRTLTSLEYRVPGIIRDHLKKLYPHPKADMVILDAGCGTGLCATFLKPYAASLVGVDLSAGMLKQARRRQLYDDLHEAELTTYLQKTGQKSDLIICADTLCYFGQLESFLQATANVLKPGGRLIFSLEHLRSPSLDGYHINTSGRYSHTMEYAQACLANAELTPNSLSEIIIRKESGEPVHGLMVEAEKRIDD